MTYFSTLVSNLLRDQYFKDEENNIMNKLIDRIYFFIVLTISITIFICSTKILSSTPIYHDNLTLGYSLRVLMSTSINNGIFPLWDHWIHGGNAMTSVYMAGNFSPIILLLSLFGVYTIKTFLIEILLMHILCFSGMYLWLKTYVNHYIALFGCFCYSLSFCLLVQTPINFEALVSASMMIWFAYGFKLALIKKRLGIGISAISLWIMFTTGYLGVNIIQLQFVITFCVIEFLLSSDYLKKRDYWSIIKSIGYACIGFILFLMIFNFAILETYHYLHFDFSQIRQGNFNPFHGALKFSTIYTMLFPNQIPTFLVDQYMGGIALLYCGSLMTFFSMYACTQYKRNKNIVLIAIATTVIFSAMLSEYHTIAILMTHTIPFLHKVQYHGWNVTLINFFVVTLGCIGMMYFYENKEFGNKYPFFFIVLYALFGILQTEDANYSRYLLYPSMEANYGKYLTYPQMFTFLIFILLIIYVYRRNQSPGNINIYKMGKANEEEANTRAIQREIPVFQICILTLLTAAEIAMLAPSLIFYSNKPAVDIIQRIEQAKHNQFDIVENERNDDGLKINLQYYSKVPAIHGYHPSMHPAMFKLKKNNQFNNLLKKIFYQADENANPIQYGIVDVKIKTFNPNEIKVDINSLEDNTLMVWSSPYTSNWVLREGDTKIKTSKNIHGLTAFTVNKGLHTMTFKYNPPYLFFGFILCSLGILISVALLLPFGKATNCFNGLLNKINSCQ